MTLGLMTPNTNKMRKIEQDKQDGSDEKHGTEQSQITQRYRFQRHQGKECSNGGDVSHNKRHGDFLQCRPDVGCMLHMRYQVERIVDRDSKDNR